MLDLALRSRAAVSPDFADRLELIEISAALVTAEMELDQLERRLGGALLLIRHQLATCRALRRRWAEEAAC